ncbi:hypothetical protein SAMN05216488_2492 [Microbacterium sp. LKL04]|uniref:hypothetical protein n=1 Tax=Microbacterium sp. LKL04 TaxID=912630 RepID=UPI000875BA77|nr:hypothetical protein [Microbacterium sp. LKL04]SCY60044.1 hypothetical protein SAMN05216488_2492 [Microbacterium sp. LKL04]
MSALKPWRAGIAVAATAALLAVGVQPFNHESAAAVTGAGGAVAVTYTSYNVDEGSYRLSPQADKTLTALTNSSATTINVNPSVSYQAYEGWGSSLEDATIYHLGRLSAQNRESALQTLVSRVPAPNDGVCRGPPGRTSITSNGRGLRMSVRRSPARA